jgi:hypothetical protein
MFLEIVQASYINDYKLSLKFNDGAEMIVDLENELNGADFAPEYLYELALTQHKIAGEPTNEYEKSKQP